MNGTSSGFLSGAASGAAMGSYFGPYGAAVGGVVGGVAGLISGSANDSQQANQQAWAQYNAQMGYNVNMSNLMSQTMLSAFNAQMIQQQASMQSQASLANAAWNVGMIRNTMTYNDQLLEQELSLMWEATDLDLTLLANQRAVERGGILANQGASGTVMDTGSNRDTVIAQKTAEALDAFIVRHGADVQASQIGNARARSAWEGEVAIRKQMWDGQMGAYVAQSNARMQVAGLKLEAGLNFLTGSQSAQYALQSGQAGIQQNSEAYSRAGTQNMVNGLFSAASRVASIYGSGGYDSLMTSDRGVLDTGGYLDNDAIEAN